MTFPQILVVLMKHIPLNKGEFNEEYPFSLCFTAFGMGWNGTTVHEYDLKHINSSINVVKTSTWRSVAVNIKTSLLSQTILHVNGHL